MGLLLRKATMSIADDLDVGMAQRLSLDDRGIRLFGIEEGADAHAIQRMAVFALGLGNASAERVEGGGKRARSSLRLISPGLDIKRRLRPRRTSRSCMRLWS